MNSNELFKQQKRLLQQQGSEEHLHQDTFILMFQVSGSFLAIGFERVQEVVEFSPFVEYPVHHERHFGVINLRGNIVPIINPFGDKKPSDEEVEQARYIIFESKHDQLVGIIAHHVKKLKIKQSMIDSIENEKIISVGKKPLRFLMTSAILEGYEEVFI